MNTGWREQNLISRLIAGSAVVAAAYLLKSFYSQATSDDLAWIIGPTAFFAEIFSNLNFTRESGYGWVDFDHGVVIAPACAGVNFLIISFCMSASQILWKTRSTARLSAGIVFAGSLSYILSIIANTIRVILSSFFFRLDIYSDSLTSGDVHRISGTCIYYLFLCFSFYLSGGVFYRKGSENPENIDKKNQKYRRLTFLIPLLWYLSFSLGIPFLNIARNIDKSDYSLFIWHSLTVGSISILITLIIYASLYTAHNLSVMRHKT